MTILSHVNINAFPLILLIILYEDDRRHRSHTRTGHLFRLLLAAAMAALLFETLAWLPEGRVGAGWRAAGYLINILFLSCACAVAVGWQWYVSCRLQEDMGVPPPSRRARAYNLAPLAVYPLLLATTPATGLLFTLDEENRYHRGPWYFLPYAMMILYVLYGAYLALRQMRREPSREKRRECLYLILFILLPLLGNFLQMFHYGWWLAWPFTAVSLLFLYLNLQNRRIVVDALTGLYNRRALDHFLTDKLARPGENWCLILLDVDGFKQINDDLGHTAGDEALWRAANVLRAQFGPAGAFLARYGGDEFAVALPCDTPAQACRLLEELGEALRRAEAQVESPYPLSLSAGFALWTGGTGEALPALLARADESMYRCKAARKAAL